MTLYAALRAGGTVPRVTADPPPSDEAMLRGDGVFETVLVHRSEPIDLPEHSARLAVSAERLCFPIPPAEAWLGAVRVLLAAWPTSTSAEEDLALRLIATRSGSAFASLAPLPDGLAAQRAGISVILADDPFQRGAACATTGAKTLSYAANLAALRQARAHGADDAIFLGADGLVTETPTATVILATDGRYTTPAAPNLLPSITAARLAPVPLPIRPGDLHAADAVFLVSALRLAAPVTAIDGVPLPPRPDIAERVLHLLL